VFRKARLGTLRATGMAMVDAREDFQRARRAHIARRAARWLSARRRCPGVPRSLEDAEGLPRRAGRLEVIPLSAIVGTLEPTTLFDARFRPASELTRKRWERIALAHRKGIALPPIVVLERPDGYYVVDGRHRVSVALALGFPDIDAYVTQTTAVASEPGFRLAA
jgi:ParB-like nuclease family protein